jgi:hypothetical protein
MIYRYSPLPIPEYNLVGAPQNEINTIMGGDRREAVWNLFWLSLPQLDTIPGSGNKWWERYQPTAGALRAVVMDVNQDEVLYRKLMLHPEAFLSWWEREDHSIFDAYDVLGGKRWAETVLRRAEETAQRFACDMPPVSIVGNVVKVNFRQYQRA